MRVAMYYRNSDVRIQEMPVPSIGPGEILVKVKASGICGSDVLEWYRIKKAPIVLGHEIAGDVVTVGDGVEQFHEGDRVFVSHHVPCNTCRYCLSGHRTACETLHTTNYDPGGFAEYLRVPPLQVDRGTFKLPKGMTYEAGTLIEPLACVLRAQKGLDLDPGSSLLVLGSGISGLLHILLSRRLGAGNIIATDMSQKRLGYATQFGANHVLLATADVPSLVRHVNAGRLAERVILCTGAMEAAKQGMQSVERGGTVLFFAVPTEDIQVPINDYWRNDITLKTSYGADPTDLLQAIDLLSAGVLPTEQLITHRLPLEEAQKGFNLVVEAQDSIKVVLEP